MASDLGKKIYRRRAEHECINAHGRRMGLQQFTVRGKENARTVLLWFALAHNMLRSFALGALAQVPPKPPLEGVLQARFEIGPPARTSRARVLGDAYQTAPR